MPVGGTPAKAKPTGKRRGAGGGRCTPEADEGLHCIAKTPNPSPSYPPPPPFSFSITEGDSSVECVSDSPEPPHQTIQASSDPAVPPGRPHTHSPPPRPKRKSGTVPAPRLPKSNAASDFQPRCKMKYLRNAGTDSREPGTLAVQRNPQRAREAPAGSALTLKLSRSPNKSGGAQLQPPRRPPSSSHLRSGSTSCLPSVRSAPSPPALGSLCQTRSLRPPSPKAKGGENRRRSTQMRAGEKKIAVSCKEEKRCWSDEGSWSDVLLSPRPPEPSGPPAPRRCPGASGAERRLCADPLLFPPLPLFLLPLSRARPPDAQMSPPTAHGSQMIPPLFINREEATVKSPAERGELRLSSTAAFHNNGMKEEEEEELIARQGVSEQELTA